MTRVRTLSASNDTNHHEQRSRIARLLGILLVLLLVLTNWTPQQVEPFYGSMIALGFWILAVATTALIRMFGKPGVGEGRSQFFLLAFAITWPIWWMIRQSGAPVPSESRLLISPFFQGALVFIATRNIMAMGTKESTPFSFRTCKALAIALVVMGTVIALHADYQILAPASLPGTYARQLAELENNREYFSVVQYDGIHHALVESRAAGRFGSPNVLAGLMALVLPLALALVFNARSWRERSIFAAIFALFIATIVLTGSRGGFVSAAFATALFAAMAFRLPSKKITTTAAVLCLLICLLGADSGESKNEFAKRWFGFSTLQHRVMYWEAGASIWSENLFIGAGPGAFEVLYPQHRVPGSQETRLAHNWIVQWGCETGIIGLLFWLGWVGLVVGHGGRSWWKWRREPDPNCLRPHLIAAGWTVAIVTAVFHGMVEFTLSTPEIYLDLCFCLGVLSVFPSTLEDKKSSVPSTQTLIISLFFLMAAAGAWWNFQLRPSLAEMRERYAGYAAEDRDFTTAITLYSDAISWQPDNADLYEARGFARLQSGDATGGEDLKRAIEQNPFSARLRQSLAQYNFQAGLREEALVLQQEAIALHPMDVMHRLVLSEMYWDLGQKEKAREILDSTDDLRPDRAEDAKRKQLELLYTE